MCFPCALPTALTLEKNDASVSVRACVCQRVSVCAAGFCLNFLTEPLPDVEARRGLQRAVLPASSRHTAQQRSSASSVTGAAKRTLRMHKGGSYLFVLMVYIFDFIFQLTSCSKFRRRGFISGQWQTGNAGFGSRCGTNAARTRS